MTISEVLGWLKYCGLKKIAAEIYSKQKIDLFSSEARWPILFNFFLDILKCHEKNNEDSELLEKELAKFNIHGLSVDEIYSLLNAPASPVRQILILQSIKTED